KLSDGRWNRYPTVARRNRRSVRADASWTLVPSTTRVPLVGRSSPAIRRSNEDLPLPDGPTTASSEEAGTSAESPFSARTSPLAVREVFTRSSQREATTGLLTGAA